jgi:hypothetical protein
MDIKIKLKYFIKLKMNTILQVQKKTKIASIQDHVFQNQVSKVTQTLINVFGNEQFSLCQIYLK